MKRQSHKNRSIKDFFSKTEDDDQSPSTQPISQQSLSTNENCSPPPTKVARRRPRIARISDSSTESEQENQTNDQNESCSLNKSDLDVSFYVNSNTSQQLEQNLDQFTIDGDENENQDDFNGEFVHETLEFLMPNKIRDANKRSPSDPGYDKATLYVPPSFLSRQSPAMQQWWQLKSAHFDTLLSFKVGKFYEFYHMDAMVVVKELNMTFMRGNFAHCGFPEIAYSKAAEQLVKRNFKVARVEQTESNKAMTERVKSNRKSIHAVNREICEVLTPGTFTQNLESLIENELSAGPLDRFAFAITESLDMNVGICFVDASHGRFYVKQCAADKFYGQVRTIMTSFRASEILVDKSKLSSELWNIVRLYGDCVIENTSFEKYCDSSNPRQTLELLKHFVDDSTYEKLKNPRFSQALVSTQFLLGYLKHCLIDYELLSRRDLVLLDDDDDDDQNDLAHSKQKMPVDASAVLSLGILCRNPGEKSLFSCLNKCVTSGGTRMLRDWLLGPLKCVEAIKQRLDAIEWISSDKCDWIRREIDDLPFDLQKMLMKIHSLCAKQPDHPDNRAVMFEEETYTNHRHELLKKCVESMMAFLAVIKTVSDLDQYPELIANQMKLCNLENITARIQQFQAFCSGNETAIADDPVYREAFSRVSGIKNRMDKYLENVQTDTKLSIKYVGTGRNRYQMEVKTSSLAQNPPPDDFILTSTKKTVSRFKTEFINDQLDELIEAETMLDLARGSSFRRILEIFDKEYRQWMTAVDFVSILDVLNSLSHWRLYCRATEPDSVCRPEFVDDGRKGFLEMTNSRHPILFHQNPSALIPNDVRIGSPQTPKAIVLTGPNMGGKSTLIRQVGAIVWMAHVGIHVPCSKMTLSVCDRIFTRIGAGAGDSSLGTSSFMAEIAEIKPIVDNATSESLVLIDELGRGTSTYDGSAIASAVLEHCVQLQCRLIFTTHYHTLMDYFKKQPVILAHMTFVLDENSESKITLLYRMDTSGPCEKSHGFNVARIAGVPEQIVQSALERSKLFERAIKSRNAFKKTCDRLYFAKS